MGTGRQVATMMVLTALLLGLGGCDWWPPTLQERIGQQDVQIKALVAEKESLQKRAMELAKLAESLRAQATQAEQANASLKSQIEQMKAELEAAKAVKKKPTSTAKTGAAKPKR